MRPLLLDTHVWIWSQECPEKLGAQTRERMLDPAQSVTVSTISTLEIARLIDAGLLVFNGNLKGWIDRSLDLIQARTIDLTHDVALAAYALPTGFHKDPADRILVATARLFDMELITADDRILAYSQVRSSDARR